MITVLTTLYDKGEFVGEAVKSVLASTEKDFELLVIDDASTDDGPAIVRSFNDPRIRLVTMEKNGGRAAAAARGLAEARGQYIAILDADDCMRPERLEMQRDFLDRHENVALVGSTLQCFGSEDGLLEFKKDPDELRAKSFFTLPVPYPGCMFRAELVRSKGTRAAVHWTSQGEDHLFILYLGEHGDYANLDVPLTDYRVGENNQCYGRDWYADRRALSAAIQEWFGIPFTEEELDANMGFFHQIAPMGSAAQVRALYRWKERLKKEVPGKRSMPKAAFHKEVEDRWRFLLPDLQDRVPKAALMHQWLSRDTDPRQWARTLVRLVGAK